MGQGNESGMEQVPPGAGMGMTRRRFGGCLVAALGGGLLGAAPALAARPVTDFSSAEGRHWLQAGSERWCWPTPNPAFMEGRPFEDYIQSTGPENPITSGLYGCVRNSGNRFHEGIDLYPIRRDRRGEPLDPVFACADGRVVYINAVAGTSGYGRYIVVEHDRLAPRILSLYAHMRDIAPGIAEEVRVSGGEVLGGLGRSAGGYVIPRERAHLHFELGFRLGDQFEAFYASQNHREPNRHGLYNGRNLRGVDPWAFYEGMRLGTVGSLLQYVRGIPLAFVVRVAQRGRPDYLARYPELLTRRVPPGPVMGWDIGFSGAGVPLQWTPRLERDDPSLQAEGTVTLLAVDAAEAATFACRRLIRGPEGAEVAAPALIDQLRLMFGLV